jgi:magnesium-protoporphyrin O-methyltransferase
MMATAPASPSYDAARARLTEYFDATARDQWAALTSDAKVSRIRETVRQGRDRMRALLLSWLPEDLRGARLLDAGCGTGALAVEAARRGARVVAVDVAAGLIDVARTRAPAGLAIDWRVGDMADPALGTFDHAVAMDSLIHYRAEDMAAAATSLARRTNGRLLFTFAPRSPLLSTMHAVGQLFPRSDRSPAIVPVAEARIRALLAGLPAHAPARSARISAGFYTSQALELAPRRGA